MKKYIFVTTEDSYYDLKKLPDHIAQLALLHTTDMLVLIFSLFNILFNSYINVQS
jgi:hypothetical protein